jgi:ABC-type branched-subunit amino acid transport system ATPase component
MTVAERRTGPLRLAMPLLVPAGQAVCLIGANEVFAALAEIKRAGTTILLVEQNARKALEITDYAYVLERGLLAHEGESRGLRQDPRVIAAYLG